MKEAIEHSATAAASGGVKSFCASACTEGASLVAAGGGGDPIADAVAAGIDGGCQAECNNCAVRYIDSATSRIDDDSGLGNDICGHRIYK